MPLTIPESKQVLICMKATKSTNTNKLQNNIKSNKIEILYKFNVQETNMNARFILNRYLSRDIFSTCLKDLLIFSILNDSETLDLHYILLCKFQWEY